MIFMRIIAIVVVKIMIPVGRVRTIAKEVIIKKTLFLFHC